MRIKSIAIATVCLLPLGSVFAQQSESGATGSMKSALLAPNGLIYEGNCGDQFFAGQMAFVEQGGKLSVKIVGRAGTCNSPVEPSGDGIKFEGCNGAMHFVTYNPSKGRYPFSGKLGFLCSYDMRPN